MSGRSRHAVKIVGLPLGCSVCLGAPGGRSVARHAHRSHIATVAVGAARCLETSRGVWVRLPVGSVAVIPAGTVHAADAAAGGGRAVSLSIPPQLLPGFARGVVVAEAPWLAEAIQALARNGDDPVPTSAVREALAELARLVETVPPVSARRTRQAVALTPSERRMLSRIRRACGWIEEGDSLADAAVAAGFYDQSHMTRQFLKYLGMTPGDYRAGAAEIRHGSRECRERDSATQR